MLSMRENALDTASPFLFNLDPRYRRGDADGHRPDGASHRKDPSMRTLLAGLVVVALLGGGCQSYNQRKQEEERARLEEQQRIIDQQRAAQREADRQAQTAAASKYVAIPLFAVGSAELDAAARHELDWFLDKIAPYPLVNIEIKGYTDSTGSESTNKPLSDKRAWAAQDYLVSKGIAANRIQAFGFGATDPARPNVTPSGRVQNRRAEVRVH